MATSGKFLPQIVAYEQVLGRADTKYVNQHFECLILYKFPCIVLMSKIFTYVGFVLSVYVCLTLAHTCYFAILEPI